LKETSFDDINSLGDSDQFCFLMKEGLFQTLISTFFLSSDHVDKQTKKFKNKKNVTDHSICFDGFLKDYSMTLSKWGIVFKIQSSFSWKNLMIWQSSYNKSIIYNLYKDLSSLKNKTQFEQIIRAKTLSNSKSFKHKEKFLKTFNLRIS